MIKHIIYYHNYFFGFFRFFFCQQMSTKFFEIFYKKIMVTIFFSIFFIIKTFMVRLEYKMEKIIKFHKNITQSKIGHFKNVHFQKI